MNTSSSNGSENLGVLFCRMHFKFRLKENFRVHGFLFHRTNGIGLAAPQVGINVQLLVFNPASKHGRGEETVLVNPHIKGDSGKTVPIKEACLSLPGLHGVVEVHFAIVVFCSNRIGLFLDLPMTMENPFII